MTAIPYVQLRKAHFVAICVILVLGALDVCTTLYGFHVGASEGNPLTAFLLDWGLLWPIKVLFPFVVALRFWRSRTEVDKLSAAWLTVGIYTLTVTLNFITIAHYLNNPT